MSQKGGRFEKMREGAHIIARRTSLMGITPSFSPFFFCEKSAKASLISFSSAAVMLCSFASLDCRALGSGADAAAGARRLGGYKDLVR